MFNEYVWKLYLEANGQNTVKWFETNFQNDMTADYALKIEEMFKVYSPKKEHPTYVYSDLHYLYEDIHSENAEFLYACYSIFDLDAEKHSRKYIFNQFYKGLKHKENGIATENEILSEFCSGMLYYTTVLAMAFPEYFVPYYFVCNYNILEKIAQEFDIALPEIPIKKNYKERVYHYSNICAALHDFRNKHEMSPYELYAFLYDFAPKYIGGSDSYIIKDQLPAPKSVFFIGGSKDDEFSGNDSDNISCWQCSPDTKAGDLIVLYLRTPISAIDSIWRSVSVGFNDPFFYWYRCTYIAHPQKIKRITQKQLQQDPVFKELPIVRKNMQGINGVELLPSAYNHLLDIAESDLPRLKYMTHNMNGDFTREKDVEEKLIKPFLEKLGYQENEYQQQLYIEIGNHNHALIPDFVIHPKVSSGHQSADFLIEAKLTIHSHVQLNDAKAQARGYAKLLNAKYSVIASKEGIWITRAQDDYTHDQLSYSWAELKKEDNFFKVYKLIGKENI